MQRVLFVVALLVAAALAIQPPANEFRKKLQGPPSEFAEHLIPLPEAAGVTSESTWYDLMFEKAADGSYVWQGEVIVDSEVELDISILSPFMDNLEVSVQPPTSDSPLTLSRDVSQSSIEPPYTVEDGPFGIDGASYPVTTFSFDKPALGIWKATIVIKGAQEPVPTDAPAAVAMITNKASLGLFSHLNRYDLEVGQEIGLVAYIVDPALSSSASSKMSVNTIKPTMIVDFPSGQRVSVPMHQGPAPIRGSTNAVFYNADAYGAVFEALEPGQYTARAVFEGDTTTGTRFVRTTEHSFNVVSPYISLTGLADVEYSKENNAYLFHIDVDVYENEMTAVKAYAEVWGTDESGYEYTPVAWMESMVDAIKQDDGSYAITLMLHEDWVHNAQAAAPFQLRKVWVQDREWSVVMSERDSVFVDSSALATLPRKFATKYPVSITEEMQVGPRPASLVRDNANSTAAKGTVVLVHGYCAGVNEFPASQFTNAVQFQDYKQARSNDAFALKIREFGNQFPAFSIVAHSQGGLAATHLHAYYWSNLENSGKGRKIQSVGSPYYGSGLAGVLASIGRIFGVGCGRNSDLTYDGASKWAAGLPTAAKKDVYYYTTQYKDAFLKRWCVFGASLVLYSPNDGTTELKKAQLVGANHAGHKEGWCHTNGMKYSNQCADPARNKEMNAAAAR